MFARVMDDQRGELVPARGCAVRRVRMPSIPKIQRYELTDQGRRIAVFFTKTYTRILTPGLAELGPAFPDEDRRPLTTRPRLEGVRERP